MRNLRTTLSLSAAVALVALAGPAALDLTPEARAYNTFAASQCNGGAEWPAWLQPAPYNVHQDGSDDLGGYAATRDLVIQGWSVWSSPCCSAWEVGIQDAASGTSSSATGNSSQNVIQWAETSWPSTFGDVNGVIGVTTPAIYSDCTIRASDMLMNGVAFTWTTNGTTFGSNVDALSIIVHEQGHWLGLDHTGVQGASMFPSYSGGIAERDLSQDDQNGVCFLYNQTCTCSTNGDCASGQVCDNGACVDAPCATDNDCGAGLVCESASGECVVPPCTTNADCPGGFECDAGACQAVCTVCQSCTTNQDCGANAVCAGFQTGGLCTVVCQDGQCPGDSLCFGVPAADGNTYPLCLNPDADTAGICPGGYTCGAGGPMAPCGGGCPAGEVCNAATDQCVADDGCTGLGNDCSNQGAACTSDNDVCLDTGTEVFCSCSCSTDADCGAGNECVQLQGGGNACVPGEAPTDPCGGACGAGEVCDPVTQACLSASGCPGLGNACDASGTLCTEVNDVCLSDGQSTFCSCTCATNADCGPNGECVDIGNGNSACVEGSGPTDPCDGVMCASGSVCNPNTGQCEMMQMTEMGTDTTTGADMATGADTATAADTETAADTAVADTAMPNDTNPTTMPTTTTSGADATSGTDGGEVAQQGGSDDSCSCRTVARESDSSPIAPLALVAGLVGLVVVRRRRG